MPDLPTSEIRILYHSCHRGLLELVSEREELERELAVLRDENGGSLGGAGDETSSAQIEEQVTKILAELRRLAHD